MNVSFGEQQVMVSSCSYLAIANTPFNKQLAAFINYPYMG